MPDVGKLVGVEIPLEMTSEEVVYSLVDGDGALLVDGDAAQLVTEE